MFLEWFCNFDRIDQNFQNDVAVEGSVFADVAVYLVISLKKHSRRRKEKEERRSRKENGHLSMLNKNDQSGRKRVKNSSFSERITFL